MKSWYIQIPENMQCHHFYLVQNYYYLLRLLLFKTYYQSL